jgi:hypothetical protein
MESNHLIFYSTPQGNIKVEVVFENETFWLSQKRIATLFDVDVRTVNEHLKNIFETGELSKNSTIRNFRIVQKEGNREVTRDVDFYQLEAIIVVGYRVNSFQATLFRIWATNTLKEFITKGFVLDQDKGKITMLEAKLKAEQEYDKYRVIQDRNYESDFDREIKKLESKKR